MMLKRIIVLFLLLFGWNYHQHAAAQDTSSTVQLSPNDETCNVVNLHIGATPTHPNEPPNRMVGAPGKIGPIGPIGGKGSKGEKGGKGSKGEEGRTLEITEVLTKVSNMLGVSNCIQLSNDFGIAESGYYLMRSSDPRDGLHVYCDFTVHEGLSNCEEIRQRVAMPNGVGHYLVRVGGRSTPRELICFKEVPILSTCDELFRIGVRNSGKYTLKAADPQQTFEVYCNFINGRAITEIWHDEMEEVQNPTGRRCQPRGCYSWSPRYKISPEQILGIITKSSECRQFIKSTCVQTQLLRGGFAWWVSRDGEKMNYWGGATSRRDGYCACGETGTCLLSYKCNCDTNGVRGTDEGYLTDKTRLPVRELRFGELDDGEEFIWHTLGKLECWGEA